MKTRNYFLTLLLALVLFGQAARADTVGLTSDAVSAIYAEQKQTEWCWAACIQMITNLYGADLSQDEVVTRAYGADVNRPGTAEIINEYLNRSGSTRTGRTYVITSTMLNNARLPAALVAELKAGHPVLLAYDSGGSAHAVVCTAVRFDGPESNPTITALTVRDPWPCEENRASAGRQVWDAGEMGPRILAGWVIHVSVHDADGQAIAPPQGYTFNDHGAIPTPAENQAVANNNLPPADADEQNGLRPRLRHEPQTRVRPPEAAQHADGPRIDRWSQTVSGR